MSTNFTTWAKVNLKPSVKLAKKSMCYTFFTN
jgi:hypothetical protein